MPIHQPGISAVGTNVVRLAVNVDIFRVDSNGFARFGDFGVLATNLLHPEELLALKSGLKDDVKNSP